MFEKNEKKNAATRIRAWVTSATTRSTNHYTITAWRMRASIPLPLACKASALPFELIPLY